MKSTARLLNLYECIYGFAVAIVLVAAAVAVAQRPVLPRNLVHRAAGAGSARAPGSRCGASLARVSALRPHSGSEAFFLPREPQVPPAARTWRSRSGARGAASGVWPGREGAHGVGGTPFVSLSVAPKELGHKDMDSNRVADRTVLSLSSMGLKRGERHTAHRQQMSRTLLLRPCCRGLPVWRRFPRAIFGPGDPARPGMAA